MNDENDLHYHWDGFNRLRRVMDGQYMGSLHRSNVIFLLLVLMSFALLWSWGKWEGLKGRQDDEAQQQFIEKYIHGLKPGDDTRGLTLQPFVLVPVETRDFDHLFVHYGMSRLMVLAIKQDKIVSSYVDAIDRTSKIRWLSYNGNVLLSGPLILGSAYNQFDVANDNMASIAREAGRLFSAKKAEIARILGSPKENRSTFIPNDEAYHYEGMANLYLDFIERNLSQISYLVKYANIKPMLKNDDWAGYWKGEAWQQAGTLTIDYWSTRSTETRPKTQVKVLYDETGLWLLWKVEDIYVVAEARKSIYEVSRDSCVAFFFEVGKGIGYMNLETNAGGTLLWDVHKPDPYWRWGKSFYPPQYQKFWLERPIGLDVKVRKSIPEQVIDPRIEKPRTWYVEMFVPSDVLKFASRFEAKDLIGMTCRGNFYKILDSNDPAIAAHNHYGAWSPLPPGATNLHQPANFAPIRFENPNPPQKASPKKPVTNKPGAERAQP